MDETAYVNKCMWPWYGWKTQTNSPIGCFCTQLYTADGDKKAIFPIMFEDVDFSTNELARGVKFVISGVNWTMCRPGVDDYARAWNLAVSTAGLQQVQYTAKQLNTLRP